MLLRSNYTTQLTTNQYLSVRKLCSQLTQRVEKGCFFCFMIRITCKQKEIQMVFSPTVFLISITLNYCAAHDELNLLPMGRIDGTCFLWYMHYNVTENDQLTIKFHSLAISDMFFIYFIYFSNIKISISIHRYSCHSIRYIASLS